MTLILSTAINPIRFQAGTPICKASFIFSVQIRRSIGPTKFISTPTPKYTNATIRKVSMCAFEKPGNLPYVLDAATGRQPRTLIRTAD